jgi:hypothetical protein
MCLVGFIRTSELELPLGGVDEEVTARKKAAPG